MIRDHKSRTHSIPSDSFDQAGQQQQQQPLPAPPLPSVIAAPPPHGIRFVSSPPSAAPASSAPLCRPQAVRATAAPLPHPPPPPVIVAPHHLRQNLQHNHHHHHHIPPPPPPPPPPNHHQIHHHQHHQQQQQYLANDVAAISASSGFVPSNPSLAQVSAQSSSTTCSSAAVSTPPVILSNAQQQHSLNNHPTQHHTPHHSHQSQHQSITHNAGNPSATPSSSSHNCWYHSNLSREDAERLLQHQQQNGSFLVRYSPSKEHFVLSVIYQKVVYHYPIDELADGFYQVNGTCTRYLGIDLLISDFKCRENSIVCALTRPVRASSQRCRPPAYITVYGVTSELHQAVRRANLKLVKDALRRAQERGILCTSSATNDATAAAAAGEPSSSTSPAVTAAPPCSSVASSSATSCSVASSSATSGGAAGGVGGVGGAAAITSDYINEKSADSGATPLIEAAKTGSSDIVRLLLESGADLNLRDCAGFTALHRACQRSFAHIVEALLRTGRANPQIKCPFSGNTPLHEAAMLGHLDCVNSLLRFYAAPLSRNYDEEMPIDLAYRFGFVELADALSAYFFATPPSPSHHHHHHIHRHSHSHMTSSSAAAISAAGGGVTQSVMTSPPPPPPPSTREEDWYHPRLSRVDTEQFLQRCCPGQDGAFLIRRSTQSERKLVLAVQFREHMLKYQIELARRHLAQPVASHTVAAASAIINSGNDDATAVAGGVVAAGEEEAGSLTCIEVFSIDKGPLHRSLASLVEHYARFADGIPCRLRFAVSPTSRVLALEEIVPREVPLTSSPSLLLLSNTSNTTGNSMRHSSSPPVAGVASSAFIINHFNAPTQLHHHHSHHSNNNNAIRCAPSHPPLPTSAAVTAAVAQPKLNMIQSDCVTLNGHLGEGEFGNVYMGHLHTCVAPPAHTNTHAHPHGGAVAVKVLVEPSQRDEFMKEAHIMMALDHPHIIQMFGVCENKKLMMILELAPYGSLLEYLLQYSTAAAGGVGVASQPRLSELYLWATQIASGMVYLESHGFVHRDLACRNVLLSTPQLAKISDFGLSRAVGNDCDYYRATRRGKWPVKWYAPESIYFKTFSSASDVWSYGVCVWEMFSCGRHPYDKKDSVEVLRDIEQEVRLPRPRLMSSDTVHRVVMQCWEYEPARRPSFADLHTFFTVQHQMVAPPHPPHPPPLPASADDTNTYENYKENVSAALPPVAAAAAVAAHVI